MSSPGLPVSIQLSTWRFYSNKQPNPNRSKLVLLISTLSTLPPNLCLPKSSPGLCKWWPHLPRYSDHKLWNHPGLLSYLHSCSVFSKSCWVYGWNNICCLHCHCPDTALPISSTDLSENLLSTFHSCLPQSYLCRSGWPFKNIGEIISLFCSEPSSSILLPVKVNPEVLTVASKAPPDLALYEVACIVTPCSHLLPYVSPPEIYAYIYVYVHIHVLSFTLCCNISSMRGDTLLFTYLQYLRQC